MTHILFGLATHLHHFQVIECDVYVSTSIVYDCLFAVILVSSVMLSMSLLFLFWNRSLPSLESKDGNTLRYVKNLHTTYFGIKSYRTSVTYLNLIFDAYRKPYQRTVSLT